MRVTGLRSYGRRGFLNVALRSDESCRIVIRAPNFKRATARLSAGERAVVRLRGRRASPKRVVIRVRAVDASGNAATLTRTVRVIR
jgi:hypothetical protein